MRASFGHWSPALPRRVRSACAREVGGGRGRAAGPPEPPALLRARRGPARGRRGPLLAAGTAAVVGSVPGRSRNTARRNPDYFGLFRVPVRI